jgi:hypothetical protein
MRFIGSVVWHWEGRIAYKARNRTNEYVCPHENSLDNSTNLGDPRYFEMFKDFAGTIWIRKPAGKQRKLRPPYTLVTRELGVLYSKEVLLDSEG